MFIIFLLIGISVTVAACFLGAFLWAVRPGQYDDDYTPAVRMLFENEAATPERKADNGKPDKSNISLLRDKTGSQLSIL